jgi:Dockerin type I domain/CARDB
VRVNVTVFNRGNFTETFNVTLYANLSVVGTQTVSALAACGQTVLTYTWNVVGWAHGDYMISAYAVPVPEETNTADNTYAGSVIRVVIPGDINGDGMVDIFDAILLAGAYNTSLGRPNWSPNADVNGSSMVDIFDAIILANHYSQHYP